MSAVNDMVTMFLERHHHGCKANKGQPCDCGRDKAREIWSEVMDRSMELTQVDYDPLAAFDQLERERTALQEMHDIQVAYEIYVSEVVDALMLAEQAIDMVMKVIEKQGVMFMPARLPGKLDEFHKKMTKAREYAKHALNLMAHDDEEPELDPEMEGETEEAMDEQ